MLHVTYEDGTGSLREILRSRTALGFQILGFTTGAAERGNGGLIGRAINDQGVAVDPKHVEVEPGIEGPGSRHTLLDALSALPTIKAVSGDDENE